MLDEARAELVAGRVDVARVSLRRRHVVALELAALETQLGEVEKDETNLRMLERRLANQVDEFVARQQVVIARYNAAEAQVQIKEAVTGVSREFAELASALAQAEERTEGMEARVSAIDRLVREGLLDPGPLSSPESAPIHDVEDQLAELPKIIEPFRTSSTVEQAAVNRKVQGSNPWSGAKSELDSCTNARPEALA